MKPIMVRDLALERWHSMDRYADALIARTDGAIVPGEWEMRGPRYLTRYWSYPRALRKYSGDLVHVLDHSYAHCLKAFPKMPSVVTVHDLHPLRVLAEDRIAAKGIIRNWLLRQTLDWVTKADLVIVTTAFTAREVEYHLRMPAQKIRVIPLGVDAYFLEQPGADAIATRRAGWVRALGREGNPPAQIVLNVGTCVPRKNVGAAIETVAILRERGIDAVLIQVGGTFTERERALIHADGMDKHVLQEPSASEAALVSAYAAANVLIMTSTFEGYGMPVIEAMAMGLPVIASGAGGLREAVGDAGIVTGTVAPDPFADSIMALLANPDQRAAMVERGRARARAHTWERTVAATQAVYAEVLR